MAPTFGSYAPFAVSLPVISDFTSSKEHSSGLPEEHVLIHEEMCSAFCYLQILYLQTQPTMQGKAFLKDCICTAHVDSFLSFPSVMQCNTISKAFAPQQVTRDDLKYMEGRV